VKLRKGEKILIPPSKPKSIEENAKDFKLFYKALLREGFTEDQAMEIIVATIKRS
jgi:hypothetical protein